jgi:hypothetical protein
LLWFDDPPRVRDVCDLQQGSARLGIERLLAKAAGQEENGIYSHGGAMSKTPYRPNVAGLTAREFAHVGTPDLKRSWLPYWEAVRDGRRAPNRGDSIEDAPVHIAKIKREIEAREAEGYAGPNRHRTYGS